MTRWEMVGSLFAVLAGVVSFGLWLSPAARSIASTIGALASVLALAFVLRLAWRLRRLDQAMQKSERMRLLGQVSGGLAHQLRNAVAGAKLAVQLHARSCADGDAESLEIARRQLGRIEADLNRFLDLGRDDVLRRPCHIVELVDEAAALLRPQCRHGDVQLCWEPPINDPWVLGDPGRLGHIVVNLMSNAVEAAGPGGQVEITVDQMDEGPCVVDIWDSGPGPDASVAGRMFQPFVTGKADGVGLGLFVARQAVEAHGGKLDWRRERGRTCFRVELPVMENATTEELVPVHSP
jgi:signal transduction histidine kinase